MIDRTSIYIGGYLSKMKEKKFLITLVSITAMLFSINCNPGSSIPIVMLKPDGYDEWTSLLGVVGTEGQAFGITSDHSGNIYTTGYSGFDLDGIPAVGFPDLFVIKFNSKGEKQWTRRLGTPDVSTLAFGITSDSDGNVYTTGTTKGDLDGQLGTGFFSLFVTKYDGNGERLWTRLLGIQGANAYATAITSDSIGNVYTTGYTDWSLDGQTRIGEMDQFVVKYNSNGEKLWTRQLGTGGIIYGRGITLDALGNLYTASDQLIAKYNSNGEKLSQAYTGLYNVSGITSDNSGNFYISGTTGENLDGQTSPGQSKLFVKKFNSNGVRQWTRQLGALNKDTSATGIASDSSGNVYITGYTTGNLDNQILIMRTNMFVVKYNSNGEKLWTRLRAAHGKRTYAYGITLDPSENIYTTGYTVGNPIYNADQGFYDLFVSRFDKN
ncbi:SBBP repeat-containing protein [Leptospira sarikeiensis]|uniref:Beta-propeller repeat protein n=1 Tax=Leptospira sarikeiensis TaxID=2484943 RepID=A0A4R9K389_9LEPT|nr:SBBP repeat-containing protein [Leptospira sarikeiensis]TGL60486.1 hypothetical protein EHQ64_11645 [Leptospira sarikeiensis]